MLGINEIIKYRFKSALGRTYSFEECEHQHLSNCYYFIKYFYNETGISWIKEITYDSILIAIEYVINVKHNSVLLPYTPHPRFFFERQLLESRGMILIKNNRHHIIDPDTKRFIGEIIDGEFIDRN